MYRTYFGLDSKPFSIAPDPRFLYLSERHREALAHLLFGLGEGGGFVQLTGEVGTGKTTLCRALLEQIPEHVDVALILNPRLNALELVATACDELGVEYPRDTQSLKVVVDALNDYLLESHAAGRRTVLMIDEAQNLDIEVLEQIRLLTNLETNEEKLLEIILIGQPELKQLLARQDLRQLSQRITARYHLEPLNLDETRAYIRHRLRVCGTATDLFTPGAIKTIHALTGGIPRLINVLCDRALLGAYVEEKRRVDRQIVRKAAAEVVPDQPMPGASPWWPRGLAAGLLLIVGMAGAYAWWSTPSVAPVPESAPAVARQPEMASALPPVAAVESTGGEQTRIAPDLESLLVGLSDETAWERLLARWGVTYQDNGMPPCEQAAVYGLRCLDRSGSWRQLINLDRPVILELTTGQGERVPVVLDSLSDDRASLYIDGRLHQVPVSAVQQLWFGDYSLLWYAPVATDTLKPGDRDQGVRWLRQRLAAFEGHEAPVVDDPDWFDPELAAAVKRFQASHSLRQDGLVGPHTFIRLNSLDDTYPEPSLMAREG